MKSAQEWKDKFCNQHIINVRGNAVENFISDVQKDAMEIIQKISEATEIHKDIIEVMTKTLKEIRSYGDVQTSIVAAKTLRYVASRGEELKRLERE